MPEQATVKLIFHHVRNNNIKLGALGFNFGTLDAFKQNSLIWAKGHLKPPIAVYQKVQGSIQKSPKRPKN